MPIIKLSRVSVISPVPFDGPMTVTLTSKGGDLFLDTDTGIVRTEPKVVSANVKPLLIPPSNVAYWEPAPAEAPTPAKK